VTIWGDVLEIGESVTTLADLSIKFSWKKKEEAES
jgi:hypothetical protein